MNEWMKHPALKTLDNTKLELIQTVAAQTQGKSGKNLASVMMNLITGANKKGIRFTNEEVSLILDILKEGKSTEEKMQIDHMINVIGSYLKK